MRVIVITKKENMEENKLFRSGLSTCLTLYCSQNKDNIRGEYFPSTLNFVVS